MQAPISVDVRAALCEFKTEGLTSTEAARLLGCTQNQASAALSLAFGRRLAFRKRVISSNNRPEFRYYPTDKKDDFQSPSYMPLGIKKNRPPRLKLVTPATKPIVYIEDGLYKYRKVKNGSPEFRREVNYKAALFCKQMNNKSKVK